MTPFFFGNGENMKALENQVHSVALSNLPVLIEGEGGSGKETLAEHLHVLSRAKGKFLRFYCRRADEALPLSEDGTEDESALLGTLYLKHISRLPPKLQQQLLGAIQAGLTSDTRGDGHAPAWRLISTTIEPLEPIVARGEFLHDLYFRLAVCRISLPPLRERVRDTRELFLAMLEGTDHAPPPPTRLWKALRSYQWPGNLRELQNFARSYAVSHDPDQIIAEIERRSASLNVNGGSDGKRSLRDQVREASRQLEAEIILRALAQHRWNRRRTAQTLKISYRALLYKMKECRLREEAAAGGD